jgi:hypothetical protein
MKIGNYKIIVNSACVIILLSVILFACNGKQKEQEETLVKQAKSIIIDNESSSANNIENTISSIRSFLSEYPDSKRYSELSGYIDDLYRCLDFHKVKEYKKKYEELSSKAYYDINSAIEELESFLDEFTSEYGSQLLVRQPQLNSLIDDVKNIKDEFKTMKLFFDREFSDLASFNSEVKYNTYKYENSSFETVRSSWKKIADSKRGDQATKDMNKKVANFEEYLQNDAERICNYNFKDFIVDGSRSIQTISIGSPSQHDTYNAKVCEGVFRVYLKGAYLGWDKGTVKISVKGMIVVTIDENQTKSGVEYRNMDFNILETTGDL